MKRRNFFALLGGALLGPRLVLPDKPEPRPLSINAILELEAQHLNDTIYHRALPVSPWSSLIKPGNWPSGLGDTISRL